MHADATSGRAGSAPSPRRPAKSLPDQRTLLGWLFAGRMVLAVAMLLAAGLVSTRNPESAYKVTVGVLIAFAITTYGAWVVIIRRLPISDAFLPLQAAADLGLATLLVYFLGSSSTLAPAVYVLVIAAYAVLMPLRAGVATALIATVIYGLVATHFAAEATDVAFWAQLLVFNVVFAVVAFLGHRLREADSEHASLQTELQRVRLEADDILHNIRSGVLTVDPAGRLAFINPTAERLLELGGTDLVGRPVLDQLKLRSTELWAAVVAGIRSGRKVARGEGTVMKEDGGMFPIGLSTTTFEQQAQDAPSVTAIFTDISDHKQLQELHLRAERLEAVAALSASLAHEIRNPLASIRSSVEQLARGRQAGEDERVLAALIVRESDRLSRILSEFLDFSRVRATRSEPVDLHAVATAAVRLVREHPDCRPDAALTVEGDHLMLEGDEDLLHRVIVNLVLNAAQAARGPVSISVAVKAVADAELPPGSDIERGARLIIRDTGPGIPDEIRHHLFEPFVSARPGGSGLGLAIVQRAVEAHRGLVFVESARGAGTTFTIFLPATTVAEGIA
ncbi:MAG TPA: ATP-binding protein [Gemmatimonadales bacterium]|jgi:two-component system sensor histidine kinase PilS (NtrC family)|nr:ATP-binding protein [Gemmatimonadales bacterium]